MFPVRCMIQWPDHVHSLSNLFLPNSISYKFIDPVSLDEPLSFFSCLPSIPGLMLSAVGSRYTSFRQSASVLPSPFDGSPEAARRYARVPAFPIMSHENCRPHLKIAAAMTSYAYEPKKAKMDERCGERRRSNGPAIFIRRGYRGTALCPITSAGGLQAVPLLHNEVRTSATCAERRHWATSFDDGSDSRSSAYVCRFLG